jgi:hypothetical protein
VEQYFSAQTLTLEGKTLAAAFLSTLTLTPALCCALQQREKSERASHPVTAAVKNACWESRLQNFATGAARSREK